MRKGGSRWTHKLGRNLFLAHGWCSESVQAWDNAVDVFLYILLPVLVIRQKPLCIYLIFMTSSNNFWTIILFLEFPGNSHGILNSAIYVCVCVCIYIRTHTHIHIYIYITETPVLNSYIGNVSIFLEAWIIASWACLLAPKAFLSHCSWFLLILFLFSVFSIFTLYFFNFFSCWLSILIMHKPVFMYFFLRVHT